MGAARRTCLLCRQQLACSSTPPHPYDGLMVASVIIYAPPSITAPLIAFSAPQSNLPRFTGLCLSTAAPLIALGSPSSSSGLRFRTKQLPVSSLSTFQRADQRQEYISRAVAAIKAVRGFTLTLMSSSGVRSDRGEGREEMGFHGHRKGAALNVFLFE
jgi:hypothetical protein